MSFTILPLYATPGPLTTIFTPPTSCFSQTPSVWSTCNTAYASFVTGLNCYWSQPANCYAPGAEIAAWYGTLFTYAAQYYYSPGVLPSGYSTVFFGSTSDLTTAGGCLTGFESWGVHWCTSSASGTYVLGTTTTEGSFAAALPRIAVSWGSDDLPSFTPTSAPALPAATLANYESSVAAARSRSGISKSTAASTSTSKGSQHTTTGAQSTAQPQGNGPGLSTGAKAGIGVGVAVGVLLLAALGFIFFRHRRRTQEYQSQRVGHLGNREPYMDAKAELPANEKPGNRRAGTAELHNQELQELGESRQPPPVPLASKPLLGRNEGGWSPQELE